MSLNELKNLLLYFKIVTNNLLKITPINEKIPHKSYLTSLEVYHICDSHISTIALNYVYWYMNISVNKREYNQDNPHNIPINFFSVNAEMLNNHKETIFYTIAYIFIIIDNTDSTNKLKLKLNKYSFFRDSEFYPIIECYSQPESNEQYKNILKKYLNENNNNLFLKQFAFRTNSSSCDNYYELINYQLKRYREIPNAMPLCNMIINTTDCRKDISKSINIFTEYFPKLKGSNANYFKSYYVNNILTQLTTYYFAVKDEENLNITINTIKSLGFEYKPIKNASNIYDVKGIDNNKNAWYYVLVNPHCIEEFIERLKDDIIHLENYGKIIHSGYGDKASEKLSDKVLKQYNSDQIDVMELIN